jgi:uncharacterized MAPEG superfamily protein
MGRQQSAAVSSVALLTKIANRKMYMKSWLLEVHNECDTEQPKSVLLNAHVSSEVIVFQHQSVLLYSLTISALGREMNYALASVPAAALLTLDMYVMLENTLIPPDVKTVTTFLGSQTATNNNFLVSSHTLSLQRALVRHFMTAQAVGLKAANTNTTGRLDMKSALKEKVPSSKIAFLERLESAEANGHESLSMYAAGVALAVAVGAPSGKVNTACSIYLASRVGYNVVYAFLPVARGVFRSLVWAVSLGASTSLWIIAANHVSGISAWEHVIAP